MTPLGQKIARLINANGPMSVADYFSICLNDRDHGYYQKQNPFGVKGDFTTAPEISQLFGEIIAVFLILAWKAHAQPKVVNLVEIGPGRGTLASDVQRVISKLAPGFADAASFHLVETSGRLQEQQRKTLGKAPIKTTWHDRLETVPDGFMLLVANELLDAIPTRQFINTAQGFRERVIGLDNSGMLEMQVGVKTIDRDLLPNSAPIHNAIFEYAPARTAIVSTIASRLSDNGGVALLLDYGHLKSDFGDTLQAVCDHKFVDILHLPGTSDLTSHVDFAVLGDAALAQGINVFDPMTQGDFLLSLGLLERAGALGAGKDRTVQQAIEQDVARLAGVENGQMGNLFKVLCMNSSKTPIPPFKSND